MSQLMERRAERARVLDERPAAVEPPRPRGAAAPRILGALALFVVAGVHLEQYIVVHFNVIPVIGPMFLLNAVGSANVGLGLLLPLRRVHPLLALGGIVIGVASIVFLEISEHQPLFGFEDYGYRAAIVIALAAEAAAAALLASYLGTRARRSR